MRFLHNIPIKRKLTILTMLTSGAALLLACVAFVTYDQVTFRHTMAEELSVLTDLFDDNLAPGLTFNDAKSLELTLNALNANHNILAAVVYDKADKPMALYQRADLKTSFLPPLARGTGTHFETDRLNAFRRIVLAGENIGTIYIASDLHELTNRFWRYGIIVSLVLLLSSLVAFAFSAKLQRIISDPISHLAKVTHAVSVQKDYSVRAIKHGEDELGGLIDGFNEMLNQIQTRDSALQEARGTLEMRVEERTLELAGSISLLNATLESTADGIAAADLQGKLISCNTKFVTLWQFPIDLLKRGRAEEMRAYAAGLIKDPETYLRMIAASQAIPEEARFDVLEFKDGRFIERYAFPQHIDGRCVGTVINFRDITERKKAAESLQRQQAELRVLFDLMPAMIWFKDTENVIVRVNQRVAEAAGKSVEEIEGKATSEIYPQEAARFFADDLDVIHSGLPKLGYVESMQGAEGKEQWVQTDKVPVRGPDGEVTGIIVMAQDITERKRAETALRERDEKFHQLADNITDVFWIRSPDLKELHYVSPAFERIWGLPVADLHSNPHLWVDAIWPEDRDRVREMFVSLTKEAPSIDLEYRILRPDQTTRWVHVRGFQVRNEAGKLVRLTGIVTDITERKRADAELEEIHKMLLNTSRQAGMAEVATSVLHNVGNVLNSVNVSTTLVAEQIKKSKVANLAKAVALMNEHATDLGAFLTTDPKGRQLPGYFTQLASHLAAEQTILLGETEQLRKNIEHIKDIVAMQQSYAKVSGVTETLKISDLVEDALRMNAGALTRHQVEVAREFEEIPPITIDKHKVLQVLVNLIRNAKYACDDSGRTDKRLIVRVAKSDGRLKITIADNGVGIPPENLVRIFSHGFTTRKDGHGFGLHSGALAAKELGGSLIAHSEGLGQGAAFTLELPWADAAELI